MHCQNCGTHIRVRQRTSIEASKFWEGSSSNGASTWPDYEARVLGVSLYSSHAFTTMTPGDAGSGRESQSDLLRAILPGHSQKSTRGHRFGVTESPKFPGSTPVNAPRWLRVTSASLTVPSFLTSDRWRRAVHEILVPLGREQVVTTRMRVLHYPDQAKSRAISPTARDRCTGRPR